jgi:hypothetical protein
VPPGVAALSGGRGLIEAEVRHGLRIGGIEDGRPVEVEERIGVAGRLFGWWRAGGGEWWWGGGKFDVPEDPGDGEGIGEEGEDPHFGAAVGADERQNLVDAGEQSGPAGAAMGPPWTPTMGPFHADGNAASGRIAPGSMRRRHERWSGGPG